MDRKFTKQQVADLRSEINNALAAVGEKHGLTFSAGNASFTDLNVTFKLEVGFAKTADFDPAREVWNANCARVGMLPEDFGKQFSLSGTVYVITGFDPNARSNSILFKEVNSGSTYCGKPFEIRSCLHPDGHSAEKAAASPANASDAAGTQMERTLWERRILFTPLKPEDLYKQIQIGTRTYQIVGFDPKARKNCVLLSHNGTTYKAPIDTVLDGLGRKAGQNAAN